MKTNKRKRDKDKQIQMKTKSEKQAKANKGNITKQNQLTRSIAGYLWLTTGRW
jgi:hypothetical protein